MDERFLFPLILSLFVAVVMNKLTTGNGNLIRQASHFIDLGVKVKKILPKSLTEQAGLGEGNR